MTNTEIIKSLRWLGKDADFIFAAETLNDAADLIESLQAQLHNAEVHADCMEARAIAFEEEYKESQRRERAHEAAIKRHYADMTSQCFICYSCVNHDARSVAKWDGKKLEGFACSGCGKGKPKWQFDVDRFSREVAK